MTRLKLRINLEDTAETRSAWLEEISTSNATEVSVAPIDLAELPAVGRLMYDSYLNTIDYDNETIEDAEQEVIQTFGGKYGDVLQYCSLVAKDCDGTMMSAVVFTATSEELPPLLAFAMTRPLFQGRKLSATLILKALDLLSSRGVMQCDLVVTEGNDRAIRLYQKIGFRCLDLTI